MNSKTPRTDANLLSLDCDDSCIDIYVKTKDGKDFYGDIVSADISRELEEKNNTLLQAMHEAVISLAYIEACFAGMALKLHPNDPDNDVVLESIAGAVKNSYHF
jgi:hypothetical protein